MSEHGHVLPLRVYLAVFLALLAGTALTTWVSTLDLGRLNDTVALSIAGVKAALVILFFMHVRYQTRLVWVFSIAGFVWLVLFFILILADYETRLPVAGWAH
jgi:cytochrome c oxidase subunit 4